MKIIALINQKGGVGKTTSTINIGAGLAQLGKKVLLIDLDSQSHLTYSLGIKPEEAKGTIYEVLRGVSTIEEVILSRGEIDVIPSSVDLAGADIEFAAEVGRENILKDNIEDLNSHQYDYILLDCPPSLGLLTLNALTTAHEVFIPLQTEHLALQGMNKLIDIIDKVKKKKLNRKLEITGIIATRFDSRRNLNNEVVEEITKFFGAKVFKTFVRENITLAEAPRVGKTIFEYRRSSHGAEDYLSLSKEIVEREGNEN